MGQLLYAMQFRGRATSDEGLPRLVHTIAFAPSCTVTTLVGPQGVYGVIEPAPGERATFESEVCGDGAQQPGGTATVTFGTTGHCLHLTLLGALPLGDGSSRAACSSLVWKIEHGDGQFAGASGLITSNLVLGDAGEVTENHFGVIFVA